MTPSYEEAYQWLTGLAIPCAVTCLEEPALCSAPGNTNAPSIFGIASTINSANFIYFLALQEVNKLGSPAAVSDYCQEMIQLHLGQGQDIYWRDHRACPTE
eukprot:gene7710-7174_t